MSAQTLQLVAVNSVGITSVPAVYITISTSTKPCPECKKDPHTVLTISPFSFTLSEAGYFVGIPPFLSVPPNTANYIIATADDSFYVNVSRTGIILLSGKDGAALAEGTYTLSKNLVIEYFDEIYTAANDNFLVSAGITNSAANGMYTSSTITSISNTTPIVVTITGTAPATGTFVNILGVLGTGSANGTWKTTLVSTHSFSLNLSVGNGTYTSGGIANWITNSNNFAGRYYQYFDLAFYAGLLYYALTENFWPSSLLPTPTSPPNRALNVAFYKTDMNGVSQSTALVINPTVSTNAIGISASSTPDIDFIQSQPGIVFIPPQTVLVKTLDYYQPFASGGYWLYKSINAGTSFSLSLQENTTEILPAYAGFVTDGGYTLNQGLNQLALDKQGTLWESGSAGTNTTSGFASYLGSSIDQGTSVQIQDTVPFIPPTTTGLSYPELTTGGDGKGGSYTYLCLKPNTYAEYGYMNGATLPEELCVYHTSKPGIVDSIQRILVPNTELGHFGQLAANNRGRVFIVGISNNTFTLSSSLPTVVYPGTYGPWRSGNVPIYFVSVDMHSNHITELKIVARTNVGTNVLYPTQPRYPTWAHPLLQWDEHRKRLWMAYLDQEPGNQANITSAGQSWTSIVTHVMVIYSDDRGDSWTPPIQVDTTSNLTTKINPVMKYDPVTYNIGLAWIDAAIDPTNDIETQVYATVLTPSNFPFDLKQRQKAQVPAGQNKC